MKQDKAVRMLEIVLFCILLSVEVFGNENKDSLNDLDHPWAPIIFKKGNNDIPWFWNDEIIFMGNRVNVSVPYFKDSLTPDIFIGCLSTENNFELRQNVRNSWAKSNVGKDILLWFVVGAPKYSDIIYESFEYNDILFLNSPEIYSPGLSTLPVKVYGFSQVVQKYFSETKWIMKADDDVFVLIDRFIDIIEESKNSFTNNTVIGKFHKAVRPIRNPFNKNHVTVHQYPFQEVDEYPAGHAYMFNNNIAKCMNELSMKPNAPYNPNEDVLTGLLARQCSPVQFVDVESNNFYTDYFLKNERNKAFVHEFKGRGLQEKLFELNCPFMKNCTKLKHTLAYSQLFNDFEEDTEYLEHQQYYFYQNNIHENSRFTFSGIIFIMLLQIISILTISIIIFVKKRKSKYK